MNEIILFLQQYGWVLTLIAIGGILILGILKYCNIFKKIDEQYRHYCYLGISVGVTLISTLIYLACIKQLEIHYFITLSIAVYALNQAFYNIFKITPINKLVVMVADKVKLLFKNYIEKHKNDKNIK